MTKKEKEILSLAEEALRESNSFDFVYDNIAIRLCKIINIIKGEEGEEGEEDLIKLYRRQGSPLVKLHIAKE